MVLRLRGLDFAHLQGILSKSVNNFLSYRADRETNVFCFFGSNTNYHPQRNVGNVSDNYYTIGGWDTANVGIPNVPHIEKLFFHCHFTAPLELLEFQITHISVR